MGIVIRHEESSDYHRVETLARDAFWNLYVPGAEEHYLIHNMRNHPDFLPELSFVIEVNGVVEGAIFYTHSKIVDGDKEIPVITFGPVFINPKKHRQGLGRKLIEYSIEEAKKRNYLAIVTLGYLHHYECYGFIGAKKYHLAMEDENYYVGLLALPLRKDGLNLNKGIIHFSNAFEVNQSDVEAYDQQFPHKRKEVTSTQETFSITSSLLDEKEYC